MGPVFRQYFPLQMCKKYRPRGAGVSGHGKRPTGKPAGLFCEELEGEKEKTVLALLSITVYPRDIKKSALAYYKSIKYQIINCFCAKQSLYASHFVCFLNFFQPVKMTSRRAPAAKATPFNEQGGFIFYAPKMVYRGLRFWASLSTTSGAAYSRLPATSTAFRYDLSYFPAYRYGSASTSRPSAAWPKMTR